MTKINRLFSLVCFDGEADAAAAAAAAAAAGSPPQFTQDDINKFLAEDRRKHVEKYKQLEASYQNILQTKGLAEDERSKLKIEFEDLQKTFRTKEQQMEFEKKQATLKYESELGDWKQKAQSWESMYKDQVIQTSLQDAAISGEAFKAEQIIGLLRPMTELRPEVDKDGRETGRLVPMIDFPDIDEKTGESIKTLRSPKDAVKRMKELPAHWGNLFKSNVVSGVGSGSAAGQIPSGGRVDVTKLTAEQYRKLRSENPELLGLKRRGK
jgi:hypothetical protein